MELVKLDTVKDAVNALSLNIDNLEKEKSDIISQNATEINELIQVKLKEISDKIKEEAIREVLGEKLNVIESKIKAEKDRLKENQ